MIQILGWNFFSACVQAEILGLVAEMAASLPEQADPADFGGVWAAGRWEFPSGSFKVEGGAGPLQIYYRVSVVVGKEVSIAGYWAGKRDWKGEYPNPVPERTLGQLSKQTATSAVCFSEFFDWPPDMDPVVHFKEELISALEAELARLRAIEGD